MKYKNKTIMFALIFMITIVPFQQIYLDEENNNKVKYQSVHDPSIVVGYMDGNQYLPTAKIYGTQNEERTRTKVYFIFGSHLAFAYSLDLQVWETFTNNINYEFRTLFKVGFDWASSGDSRYDPAGNMWAPDVIWNPTLNKWTMYMSINGRAWNSCIFLLTADSLNGNWRAVGPVFYSGFTGVGTVRSFTRTDFTQATGESYLANRYIGPSTRWAGTEPSTWNTMNGPHAIDPCVYYGDDNKLYLSYGSWTGGIFTIILNKKTGLRDYNIKYPYIDNQSDPYFGHKIAGGHSVSGEGAYIQKINNYYFLWVSYGGLNSDGGYNMRIFRSSNSMGPYVDKSGNSAIYLSQTDNINGKIGVRELTYYKWNYMGQGYAAEGHNSVFVDDDGRAFVVYHTRYTNNGEVHTIRVHQIFVNEQGWIITAPFQFSGERLDNSISSRDVAGTYEVIFHTNPDYKRKIPIVSSSFTFTVDGKVSGAKTGTWAFSSKGSPYVIFNFNKVIYHGVFIRQRKDSPNDAGALWNTEYTMGETVMTFTCLGDNQFEVFGFK